MNKDLLNQLPADQQPVAFKLESAADNMQLSPAFQWDLETQLMEAFKSKTERRQTGWFMKILVPAGWVLAAVSALFLLNWTLRSIAPGPSPAADINSTPDLSFETNVRQGTICSDPLAIGYGFDVFLTNADKTGLIPLDEDKTIGELRSFEWSPDGEQLAIAGNSMGRGNIYFTDPAGGPLEYLLYSSEVGYLLDATWSRDGKQLLLWSSQNNKLIYLVGANGNGLVEKQLEVQIFGTPRFAPDGKSVVFYGADANTDGLFQVTLDDLQARLNSDLVEDESAYAFSPDGSRLAYIDMDRDDGGAILMVQELETRAVTAILGSLPIPKGSGSSIPDAANFSWSQDGKFLVFEFGRSEDDRAVYLVFADGTGLVKVAEAAHAPAISADGRCLAYISNKQVFLLDLMGVSPTSINATPVLLADLPTGRAIADFRLDKLQWRP